MTKKIFSNTNDAERGDTVHPEHVIIPIWVIRRSARNGLTTVYTKTARKGGPRKEGKIRIPTEWIMFDGEYARVPLNTEYPQYGEWGSKVNRIKKRIFGYIPLRKHFEFTC